MVLILQRLHLVFHASFVFRPLVGALPLITSCSSTHSSPLSLSFAGSFARPTRTFVKRHCVPFVTAFCDPSSSKISGDSCYSASASVSPSSHRFTPLTSKQHTAKHRTMSAAADPDTEPITLDLLQKQGATSTNAIVHHLQNSETFTKWSDYLSNSIRRRDDEDGYKLDQGIDIAIQRGTLQKLTEGDVHPYQDVDVLGKKPMEIADFIWEEVIRQKNENGAGAEESSSGELIVLCGLSGTGKGTTFATLGAKLRTEKGGDNVVNWSNGNVFRCITLLSILWCEQEYPGEGYDKDKALTKENIANFMSYLSFEKINGKYDTRVRGLGLDTVVSKIENTLLKQSNVARLIPTVAEQIQGEVIHFANSAIATLRKAGMTILLEGREQTLNYITTPYKFRLIMSDGSLIGKRRAAQLLAAAVLERIECDEGDKTLDLEAVLEDELQRLAAKDMSN